MSKEEQDIIRGIKQTVVIWSILTIVIIVFAALFNAWLNRQWN